MNDITLIKSDFFDCHDDMESESIDLILTDPPYNILQQAGQSWDVEINWKETEEIFARLLKPYGQLILFCDIQLAVELIVTFNKYLAFRGFHIWHKPGGAPSNKYHPISNSEHILVFRKKQSKVSDLTFNPKVVLPVGKPYVKRNSNEQFPTRRQKKSSFNTNPTGERWVKTVLSGPSKPNMKKAERTSHPTQKPLNILQDLVRCYSNPGDMILDPFAGSASTLIASHNEDRPSMGVEKEKAFYEKALERIERHLSQQNLFKSVSNHKGN